MGIKLINLNPHPINICDEQGNVVLTIPKQGLARVSQTNEIIGSLNYEGIKIPLIEATYGDIQGLPDPKTNEYYIVSLITALMLKSSPIYSKYKGHILVPNTGKDSAVRDKNGNIIGVKSFILF